MLSSHTVCRITQAVVCLFILSAAPIAATLPQDFTESVVASGLESPTTMQFAPDGRLFVLEQAGRVRVIQNGALLDLPFMTLTVENNGERGLLGIAFDPDFADPDSRWVYLYYTVSGAGVHNRVIRVKDNDNVADTSSQQTILDLEPLGSSLYHNGGSMAFGPDGKLYIGVGENFQSSLSQSMTSRFGKMLRLNADGTIPADNPLFNGATSGVYRAIWAVGLRNPNNFSFNPAGTDPAMIINDVGEQSWEEVNLGLAGANYGWPITEGDFIPATYPDFTRPIFAYFHNQGCAIVGSAFYPSTTIAFPVEYQGKYFYADYCGQSNTPGSVDSWIGYLDPTNPPPITQTAPPKFAGDIAAPVEIRVGSDGALYYLDRGPDNAPLGSGAVYRVQYGNGAPGIVTHPADQAVNPGQTATFSVTASGADLTYQWQRNQADIAGATSATYSFTAQPSDDNATFRVRVANGSGNVISNSATLTVSSNQAPVATITTPTAGTFYAGGETINYSGTGLDPEDGARPGSAFTWQVDLHHDAHVHPFIPATSGATSGSFVIPKTGHTETNVWYRIRLTVTDSTGATDSVFRDINPLVVQLTLTTGPGGLPLLLDSQPVTAPITVSSVVGVLRSVEAQSQATDTVTYTFSSWSDGGAARHDIDTPPVNTTYVANFTVTTAPAISTQPTSVSVVVGGAATFNVVASGTSPLSYQWRRNGSDIPGATEASYVLSPVQLTDSGAQFSVRVTNSLGNVVSDAAGLTVSETVPQPPTGFGISANGATLSATWTKVAGAMSYNLEVGSATGTSNLLNLNVGDVAQVEGMVPIGTYYARVRAVHAIGLSEPSNESTVQVTTAAACLVPPPVPGSYTAVAGGLVADFHWTPSAAATTYVLDVGSAPGATDLLRSSLGGVTSYSTSGPAGTYYTRLRAANACGESAATPDVPVVLGCSAGAVVPTGLSATTTGGVASFVWQAPVGATSYRAQVGSAPGLSNLLDVQLGAATSAALPLAGVPSGTYYVRIQAVSACGVGAPSNEVQIVVP
ncbi:MAG: PQQ-dependent sugar dehydrogenase [Acidobacteriota bacterium]